MTRQEVKNLLPVLQAFAGGKPIQSRCIKGDTSLWYDDDDFSFDDDLEYRIKPSPTYRPFANAEECVMSLKKHSSIVKSINDNSYWNILFISDDGVSSNLNEHPISFQDAINKIKFADGSVFGVKVEE